MYKMFFIVNVLQPKMKKNNNNENKKNKKMLIQKEDEGENFQPFCSKLEALLSNRHNHN